MAVQLGKIQDDMGVASEVLRKALPQMIRRKIPPTPQNYALWYAQAKGIDPEFGDLLLREFPGIGDYNPEKSESLFFEFFVKDYLPNNPKAQKLLVKIIAQLTQSVATQLNGTEKFCTTIEDALEDFNICVDPEHIKEILKDLTEKAHSAEQVNHEFQAELLKAQKEMLTLKEELTRTKEIANIDALTKVSNRRAFNDHFKQVLQQSGRVSILLIDIDHFKKVNDTYGHPLGDRVLTHLGTILLSFESDSVFVARYGGEEFSVIALKGLEEALVLAEEIRKKVTQFRITNKKTGETVTGITISIGVAERDNEDTPEGLLERVDKYLYHAKATGRNRVCSNETG